MWPILIDLWTTCPNSTSGDADPGRWDRTFGDRSGGTKKDAERELEKPIWYNEVKVVVKKLNVRREANTISDLQTNLVVVAVASFRPICRSRCCQTHLSITPLSDPPAHLAFFRPTHQFVVLYLSLSLNLSLPLPFSRSMLIFEEDWIFFVMFFLLIWFIYLDFLL